MRLRIAELEAVVSEAVVRLKEGEFPRDTAREVVYLLEGVLESNLTCPECGGEVEEQQSLVSTAKLFKCKSCGTAVTITPVVEE
jgi:hypothetical protein